MGIAQIEEHVWYNNTGPYFIPFLTGLGWTEAQAKAAQEHIEGSYCNSDEYENTDNLRLARAANAEEMAVFHAAEDAGCCGTYHHELAVEEADGSMSTVLVGFNYGH